MSSWKVLYHIIKADLYQRIRSYSFLVVIGVAIALGYFFVPHPDASYVTVDFYGYRSLYNSAWIGSMVTLLTTTFLSLVGFYLTKNTLERDQKTGVNQIIAATPISKFAYIFGKVLSNYAVLVLLVCISIVSAFFMQLYHGEVFKIELCNLILPFLLITLPGMFVIAALAVCFETITSLRNGFGNIIYFGLWLLFLVLPDFIGQFDLLGANILMQQMTQGIQKAFPQYSGELPGVGFIVKRHAKFLTFSWDGVNWTLDIIIKRFAWLMLGFILVFLATYLFKPYHKHSKKRKRVDSLKEEEMGKSSPHKQITLTPVDHQSSSYKFQRILLAEWKLMLKWQPWWWYAVAIFFAILSFFDSHCLLLSWIWPILIWSNLGTRETKNDTHELIFSTPYPICHQLPATWFLGVLITILMGSGACLHLIIQGSMIELIGFIQASLFIPTLAISLGVWSGNSKLFECLYMLIWFFGPVNQVPVFDYMGISTDSIIYAQPLAYPSITLVLFILAWIGRRYRSI